MPLALGALPRGRLGERQPQNVMGRGILCPPRATSASDKCYYLDGGADGLGDACPAPGMP